MKPKCALLFLAALAVAGCKTETAEEDASIVFEAYEDVIVARGAQYDLNEMAQHKPINVLYDQVDHKLWIHSIKDGKSNFQFLEKSGVLSEPIVISYEEVMPLLGGTPFIYRNIALLSASSQFKNVDINSDNFIELHGTMLDNAARKLILANVVDGYYSVTELAPEDFLFQSFSGFSGEFIFGEDWSYDIKRNEKSTFPAKLLFPAYMAEIDRIVGIDDGGNTVAFDYRTGEHEILPIKKRKLLTERFFYSPESLYYVNEDYVYFSEYSKWYPPAFYFTYFFKSGEPRNWYRYDRSTGETVKIKAPNERSRILGVLD